MRIVPKGSVLSRIRLKDLAIVDKSLPFIITDALDKWPSTEAGGDREWTLGNLMSRPETLRSMVVPVEFFGNYMSSEMQQLQVEIGDLFNFFHKEEMDTEDHAGSGMTIDHLYLAQYELKNLPELEADCGSIPDALLGTVGRGLMQKSNIWLGKKGVMSPAHIDPFFNLFCQIKGHKRIILFPNDVGQKFLYPATGTAQKNTTRVGDVEAPDLEKFPLIVEAFRHAQEVDLAPGEALFIPKHHWHHCRALSLSFSVNHWWL
jgi:[protein]-arginine 3-hydroxylase / protease